eukprot:m.119827 g.119827  ORF g.119827 m.119827 type:complete len:534 (-) comp23199_c0_seq1:243-1844(-)
MAETATTPTTPDTEPSDPCDQALHIIDIDADSNKLLLHENLLEQILLHKDCVDKPVVVVSVAGPLRGGKSFLLNFFLRYMYAEDAENWLENELLDLQKGFKWRYGSKRETTGIWMWGRPFVRTLPDGREVAVLLMDTQGTFDNQSTMEENATIFALTALMSSCLIYNIPGLISEDVLQHMHLFTKFGKMVQQEDMSGEKPFQNLQFLVRDWKSKDDHPFGLEGGNSYLDQVLDSSSVKSENSELVTVRKELRACHERLQAYLMPHPGTEVAEESSFHGELGDIRPLFVQHLATFVPYMLKEENLLPKKMSGDVICGSELVEYIKAYVKVFQTGELPQVATVFEATATVNHMNIKRDALEKYREVMRTKCAPSMPHIEASELEKLHAQALEAAMSLYRDTKKLKSESLEQRFTKELDTELLEEYQELVEANKRKSLMTVMKTPLTFFGIAFCLNIFSTFLSLIGLGSVAVLISYITWLCLLSVAFWAYSHTTGKFPEVMVEIDNTASRIFEQGEALFLQYAAQGAVAARRMKAD